MEQLEAESYDVKHCDCPACMGVNGCYGQDDVTGEQDCTECGTTVTINP